MKITETMCVFEMDVLTNMRIWGGCFFFLTEKVPYLWLKVFLHATLSKPAKTSFGQTAQFVNIIRYNLLSQSPPQNGQSWQSLLFSKMWLLSIYGICQDSRHQRGKAPTDTCQHSCCGGLTPMSERSIQLSLLVSVWMLYCDSQNRCYLRPGPKLWDTSGGI